MSKIRKTEPSPPPSIPLGSGTGSGGRGVGETPESPDEPIGGDVWNQVHNLSDILDSLGEGIIAHDLQRKILYFNRAAEAVTGYPREEVVGRDCHQVFGSPFCGDQCLFCEQQVHLDLDRKNYSMQITDRRGKNHRLEMTVVGMKDGRDRLIGVLASFRDVNELLEGRTGRAQANSFAGLVGNHPRMREIFQLIRDLAHSEVNVCITGETGTGKELVATAIHRESWRGHGPFIPINCGALPEGILESELFGHVKGAFTGATYDRKGRFELANQGTLFLDEVAELPARLQVKLLRVLQEGCFEPVGSEKTIRVDVRVISATNRDLKDMVRRGTFRQDLFYRLNVVPVHAPSLRERASDIPLLVDHFLALFTRQGKKTVELHPATLQVLLEYNWPGNVRELYNVLEYGLIRTRGQMILPEDLPPEIGPGGGIKPAEKGRPVKLNPRTVQDALKQSAGNRSQAARLLGVGRATLYRFLNQS
ncbi:MAG: sigma 54-interacting transcriptional regulator [Deltaproteobacteria bacterium]|nr:sigma 54-interacting transcriptional regulator [Deltaproteobacteria bacterium]